MLLLLHAGPLTLDESGANNHPLRGGKYSSWEGGIRAAAFAAGGYLPSSVRGTQQEGMMHVADWYTVSWLRPSACVMAASPV